MNCLHQCLIDALKRYSFDRCVYCLVEKKSVLRRLCGVLTSSLTIVSENVFKLFRKTAMKNPFRMHNPMAGNVFLLLGGHREGSLRV